MDKLAQAQILTDAAVTIRQMAKVAAERDEAVGLVQRLQLRAETEKLASEMLSRGLGRGQTHSQLVSHLEKQAEAGRLDAVKEALDMVGQDFMPKVASQHDMPGTSSAESRFLNFLTQ